MRPAETEESRYLDGEDLRQGKNDVIFVGLSTATALVVFSLVFLAAPPIVAVASFMLILLFIGIASLVYSLRS